MLLGVQPSAQKRPKTWEFEARLTSTDCQRIPSLDNRAGPPLIEDHFHKVYKVYHEAGRSIAYNMKKRDGWFGSSDSDDDSDE